MRIIRSKLGDLWLKLAAFVGRSKYPYTGSTISSKTVVLRRQIPNPVSALAHELVHVDQIKKMGWLKMRWRFFWQDVKHGHQKAPLELDAYQRWPEFIPKAREVLGL